MRLCKIPHKTVKPISGYFDAEYVRYRENRKISLYAQKIDSFTRYISESLLKFSHPCNTLSRLGFNANIEYIDTLSLSRKYLHGLENYKQSTIENYFGLTNPSSHRAASDAENCGHILYRLMDVASESLEIEKR